MNSDNTKNSLLKRIYKLCPAAHITSLVSAVIILAHLALRNNRSLMQSIYSGAIKPVHTALATACDAVSFSVAELLIALLIVWVLVNIVLTVIRAVRKGKAWERVYRLVWRFVTAVLLIYAMFCLLWGTYYYADDFISDSGFVSDPISAEELTAVTRYFADIANEYAPQVERNEDGVCETDREEILKQSPYVYEAVSEKYPCFEARAHRVKGIHFSKLLSFTDFTGFFFPFTAEANVNTDSPAYEFAATVAHELAHQRGVAREQDANFTAVLACLEYGDPDFCYSAATLAYTYLGNALYSADPDAWLEIYSSLSPEVRADFAYNRAYWAQYETPVRTASNKVYDGFLKSYDQPLGIKSYGACVDLLVNYYYPMTAGTEAP